MCDERERLIGFLYDECDASERRLIETHLETCQTCREEIGGLRRVRDDLLAWDVPPRDSVWMPFAPPRPATWWREVPAWALAAAASVTFVAGAAGGIVTHALMPPSPPALAMVEVPDRREPIVPVSYDPVTRRELTAVEQRIVELMRAEIARLARDHDASPSALRVSNTPQPLVDVDHSDLIDLVRIMIAESVDHRRVTQGELQNLKSQVESIQAAVIAPSGK